MRMIDLSFTNYQSSKSIIPVLDRRIEEFFGKLRCVEDQTELRLGDESSIILGQNDPCEKVCL